MKSLTLWKLILLVTVESDLHHMLFALCRFMKEDFFTWKLFYEKQIKTKYKIYLVFYILLHEVGRIRHFSYLWVKIFVYVNNLFMRNLFYGFCLKPYILKKLNIFWSNFFQREYGACRDTGALGSAGCPTSGAGGGMITLTRTATKLCPRTSWSGWTPTQCTPPQCTPASQNLRDHSNKSKWGDLHDFECLSCQNLLNANAPTADTTYYNKITVNCE